MPLCQMLDATLHLNSAQTPKGGVQSPNVSVKAIKPIISSLGCEEDNLNKSTMIQVLQDQSKKLTQERDSLLDEKKSLQIEIEEYRKAIIKMQEPQNEYREEIAEQESYIDDCEEQIGELNEQLASGIEIIKQQKSEIRSLRAHVESQNETINKLKLDNMELRQELTSYKKRRLSQQTGFEVERSQDDKRLKIVDPLAQKEIPEANERHSNLIQIHNTGAHNEINAQEEVAMTDSK